ncbi:MAG: hypothetical protein HRU03_08110 [Nanoarchaeales archaeon]|nr:hypothetical protein [Nanoarchaeales archaeon]
MNDIIINNNKSITSNILILILIIVVFLLGIASAFIFFQEEKPITHVYVWYSTSKPIGVLGDIMWILLLMKKIF